MRYAALFLIIATAVVYRISPAHAAQLVMYQSSSCAWCERWEHEIGVAYDKTSEGHILPLRRIDADADELPADLSKLKALTYTPTFVIVDHGRELARIVGYPGEEFFYPMLDGIIKAHKLSAPVDGKTASEARCTAHSC